MQDDSVPLGGQDPSDWNAAARQALEQVGSSITLPGPCTYRLIVRCGPASTVDHIQRVFTTTFGYGQWEVRSAGHEGGAYELHGLRTVKLCTLEELLQHYREVAEVMSREDCGTHRILIEPVT